MYGLINQAVKDFVVSTAGTPAWEAVCKEANVSSIDFGHLSPYPDQMTYSLVKSAATQLDDTLEGFLQKLGRYWILFTATHGYGEILNLLGRDLISCLRNLNHMHAHLGASLPELQPPRFVVEEKSSGMTLLHYYSHRPGMGALVVGILEGLAEKFEEQISIQFHPRGSRSDHDEFEITFI